MDSYRCLHCKFRVANLICLSCSNQSNQAYLCYECDSKLHPDIQHRKQLLQDLASKRGSINNTPQKSTPLKLIYQNSTKSANQTTKKNYEVELMQLQFEKKIEDKNEEIAKLEHLIEEQRNRFQEQISKMREYLIVQEEDMYILENYNIQRNEEHRRELDKQKKINQERVEGYKLQVEEQKLCNQQLEQKIHTQKQKYESQIEDLKMEIQNLHQKFRNRMMSQQKIENELNQAVSKVSLICSEQKEKKSEIQMELDELKHKLYDRELENEDLRQQLSDCHKKYQEELISMEYQFKQQNLEMDKQYMDKEGLLTEIRNLQKEIKILEKENDLFQKDKLLSLKQIQDQQALINQLQHSGKSRTLNKSKSLKKMQK